MSRGESRRRAWEDKEGNKRSTTEIIASDMRMLDSKGPEGRRCSQEEPPLPHPAGNGPLPEDDVPF